MPKAYENSKEMYIYPAVFTYEDAGIVIEFPDLPGCSSCADNDNEAVYNAKEVLSLHLYGMEEDKSEIPTPTDISKIALEDNQRVFPIDVWMPYHRAKIKTYYVKKTLTIPNWLNVLAEEHNINFSRLLRKSLVDYLGITDTEE